MSRLEILGRIFRVSPEGEAEEWQRYTRSTEQPSIGLDEARRIFDEAHEARARGD